MSNTNRIPPPDHVLKATLKIWNQAGGQHLIPITGRSMLPLIQHGDYVLVAHGWTGLRRGDVAVFKKEGALVAHRVLSRRGNGTEQTFITKGDHCLHLDLPVPAGEMVGRVLIVKRGDRLLALDTPTWRVTGRLIAVSTLPLATLYSWIRNLKHNLWGPQPRRLSTFLHRSALAFFSIVFKIIQVVIGRWQK